MLLLLSTNYVPNNYLYGGKGNSRATHYVYDNGTTPHGKEETLFGSIANQHLSTMDAATLDRDWKLNEFFGHIKVLGGKTSSRYGQLVEEMQKIGLSEDDFIAVPGVEGADLPKKLWSKVPDWAAKSERGKQGVAGCTIAHYNLILDTKTKYDEALNNYNALILRDLVTIEELTFAQQEVKKYSSVLILENNAAFGSLQNGNPELKGVGTQFRQTIKQLPNDWDMFYFMCLHGDWGSAKQVEGAPRLLRATYGVVNKCFAINHTAYDAVVKTYEAAIKKSNSGSSVFEPCDHLVAQLHKNINAYIAKDPLAYRFASNSMVSDGGDFQDDWQPLPH